MTLLLLGKHDRKVGEDFLRSMDFDFVISVTDQNTEIDTAFQSSSQMNCINSQYLV